MAILSPSRQPSASEPKSTTSEPPPDAPVAETDLTSQTPSISPVNIFAYSSNGLPLLRE
jgi:hypothetical protein